MIEIQIDRVLSECDKHLARMRYAAAKMSGFTLPTSIGIASVGAAFRPRRMSRPEGRSYLTAPR